MSALTDPSPAPDRPLGAFGIDIGGSGIKGAPVDLVAGELSADRARIPTPQPATPQAVAATVAQLVDGFDLPPDLPVGVTFPAVIQHGVARSAANVDDSWIGTDVEAVVGQATGRRVVAVNDADAAGYAETLYGAARGRTGTVLVVTLGTGIGTCLVVDGTLVPNTELGHLEIDGFDAESRAADSAREREDLDWTAWAERLQRYFRVVEDLLWPDLIVVGGGVSKKHDRFLPLLDLRTPVVPAGLRNAAGIVGAAALAADVAAR
ncbi:polyphosphate--glucose phosphotransferase [Cellulomonas bogoriensis]|uniref:Polyphosphate glucokinase n=1 Tax=Cellulomonas bogoriensis 69B4 = DSM 16987 TaxID=1386082 RepID=A0A0A0C1F1_9CELL|nr:ROK family protein [Cellulomonas bogoriensis]KGM14025.1 polyphosphate glucokinase [Cellulomonas bogoriensis 69B4 = DSM 16987]